MDPLNYFANNRWEYLFSGENGIKDLFHPGPHYLRYDENGRLRVNADCREANGLLYTGTDYLKSSCYFGAGEFEFSLDASVTGSKISLWAFFNKNRVRRDQFKHLGVGFEITASRDGALTIIDHYKDEVIPTLFTHANNPSKIILNITAVKDSERTGIYFYADKRLLLEHIPDVFHPGELRLTGGIYEYIKFRGAYRARPDFPPPPG